MMTETLKATDKKTLSKLTKKQLLEEARFYQKRLQEELKNVKELKGQNKELNEQLDNQALSIRSLQQTIDLQQDRTQELIGKLDRARSILNNLAAGPAHLSPIAVMDVFNRARS
jgi:glutaredoxin 2